MARHGARRRGRERELRPSPDHSAAGTAKRQPVQFMTIHAPTPRSRGGRWGAGAYDPDAAEEERCRAEAQRREVPSGGGGHNEPEPGMQQFLARNSSIRAARSARPRHWTTRVWPACRTPPPGRGCVWPCRTSRGDVLGDPVAQPVEALVRAIAGLVVDPGGRRVADEHVGGRSARASARRLLLRVLVRPVAVADAALEARERHASELDPAQMQVGDPERGHVAPSWLP